MVCFRNKPNCVWISLKFFAPFVYMSQNLYPLFFSLSICCKNLVMSVLLDFTKDRERSQFEQERDILGQLSDDKIINLIIILVQKCIFLHSQGKRTQLLLLILWLIYKHITYMKKDVWYWCIFEGVVELETSFSDLAFISEEEPH